MAPVEASTVTELEFEPFSYAAARRLARELDLLEPVAVALARRGYGDPEAARAFLAADESHAPTEFEGMAGAVAAIRSAITRGERITIHGDYDVDGVSATAILVGALRELGADCDWLIPSRTGDGYGLSLGSVERLAERGTKLLITVDCGVTSVAEVAAARERGIAVVVTDHHQPGAELPDCPIVHPTLSGYPCADLCAAAVAHKVVAALAGVERAERDLDLVALATVADLVPLAGENRSLVRRGLERARRAPRLGLRALIAAAQVVPERLDEQDLGFRLAPRINAAGRLYRADAAVELLLTGDDRRAAEIAAELDRANRDRREIEAEVSTDAERQLRDLDPEEADAPAIVLWGEGWHPGVIGISASRLAERHLKPTVLIALSDDGTATGSGRSIPGFDLLAGLETCAPLLERYGGHRAAAGLEVHRESLDAFRERFQTHARAALAERPPRRVETVDAVVGAESLTHELGEQLARLGPFGKGNPEVRLLVPGAQVGDVWPMGEGERHARFTLASGPARASGVAFRVGPSLGRVAQTGPLDLTLRLELDEWNGAVTPRAVLGTVHERTAELREVDWPADEFARRFRAEHDRAPRPRNPALPPAPARDRIEHSGSELAAIAGLASSGEPVLVICADALWRRELVEAAVSPRRFGGGRAALIASRGSVERGVAAASPLLSGTGGVALADWAALELTPDLPGRFVHVALVDPAPRAALEPLAVAGEGYVHVLRSHGDPSMALKGLALALPGRAALAGLYRALRDAPEAMLDPAAIDRAARTASGGSRSPEWCAQAVRTLCEAGILRHAGTGLSGGVEVVSSVRGELGNSPSYAANKRTHEECVRFLTQDREQRSSPLRAAA